jgi:glutamine synthetase
MVGSSDSIAAANYTLNTIAADSLEYFYERLKNAENFDKEVEVIIADTIKEHGRIIYNGNNYAGEWHDEAKRRGLPNISDMRTAADVLVLPENTDLFERFGVFSKNECLSRHEILLEHFVKITVIECNTMLTMVRRQILPAAIGFIKDLAQCCNELRKMSVPNAEIEGLCRHCGELVSELSKLCDRLDSELLTVSLMISIEEKSNAAGDVLKPTAEKMRIATDKLEECIGAEYLKLPSYTDLLYKV